MSATTAMIDNRFLHDLAMERKARQSQMRDTCLPDIVPEEINWESDCDYLESETGYDSDDLSEVEASDGERGEDTIAHPDHADSILSQSTARDKLESMMSFAEDAGLDKPSARIALSKSMGDEDR